MSDPARPKQVTVLCAAMQCIGGGLGWSLLPALMPMISKDLGVSHTQGGFIWGAASLGIALASPFGGSAVDRLGARQVAGVAMLLGAAACASRAFAQGPWTLALSMFAFGLHVGFTAPAIPKAIAGHVEGRFLGRANGIALLSYTFGTALTVLCARFLAMAVGGWRPLMVVAGGAMAVVAALWLRGVPDRMALSHRESLGDLLALTRSPDLRRVAGMHFLLFGGYLALLGFLPRALIDAGVPPVRAGATVALWLCAAGMANFAGPWLSDRLGRRRPVILAGAAISGIALLPFIFLPVKAAAWFLALAALGGGAFAPLLLTLPFEMPEIGLAKGGAALGLLMLVGQAGGFLLPVAAGVAAQYGRVPAAMGLMAAVHLAIVFPALRYREVTRQQAKSEVETVPQPLAA
jgi:nitrate/nitrite transporter NarK